MSTGIFIAAAELDALHGTSDRAARQALDGYLAGGLHAAAASLAAYAYRHIGELKTREAEKATQ